MKKFLLISCFFVSLVPSLHSGQAYAETKEVPFTLDDKYRLVRVEEQQKSLQTQINGLSEDLKELRADLKEFRAEIRADIRMLIYTFFGGIFVSIGSIVGFVLWDRRTTLAPVVKENNSIKQALIDFAEKNSYMKKALKRVAIL